MNNIRVQVTFGHFFINNCGLRYIYNLSILINHLNIHAIINRKINISNEAHLLWIDGSYYLLWLWPVTLLLDDLSILPVDLLLIKTLISLLLLNLRISISNVETLDAILRLANLTPYPLLIIEILSINSPLKLNLLL